MLSRLQHSPNSTLQQRPSRQSHRPFSSPAHQGRSSSSRLSSPASLVPAAAGACQHSLLSPAAPPTCSKVLQQQQRRSRVVMASTAPQQQAAAEQQQGEAAGAAGKTLICTSITASTVEAFLQEIQEAAGTGVDIIELRLDFLQDFTPDRDLDRLMGACSLPYIITYRPKWEGGNYEGPEPQRLATLKLAAIKGAPYVDVEWKAAALFFAGAGEVPITTKIILSNHNFQETPPAAELQARAAAMWESGADIVKIAAMANDITDSAAVLSLLQNKKGPTIALAMGEKGNITRLLAAKYGGHLTFAALSPERASAPGQPTISQLQQLYSFSSQGPDTKLFGIMGRPVSHSKSPLIHNSAFKQLGFNGVFVPLLVDDLHRFLEAFEGHDFWGFSCTIPHKEAAFAAASSSAGCDPVAAQIGAVNTLIRQPQQQQQQQQQPATVGGSNGSSSSSGKVQWRGYNTDWLAAISAIERVLAAGSSDAAAVTSSSGSSSGGAGGDSPLKGKTVCVVGAGGAGRALAFGAASKGSKVIIANRNKERAEALAAALPAGVASVVDWSDLQAGKVSADVLANSTSVGMVPNVEDTPVATDAVKNFKVVFDAVYTPRETRLLRDAVAAGCLVADGVAMFVGQAVEQLKLFTGTDKPPVQLMEDVVVGKVSSSS